MNRKQINMTKFIAMSISCSLIVIISMYLIIRLGITILQDHAMIILCSGVLLMIVYQIMEIINVIQEQPRAYFLIKLVIACIAYIIVGFIFYLGYIASNGFLDMLFFGLLIMTCIFLIFTKVRSFIKRTNDTYTTMFIDYILLALSIVFIVSIVI